MIKRKACKQLCCSINLLSYTQILVKITAKVCDWPFVIWPLVLTHPEALLSSSFQLALVSLLQNKN